MDFIDNNNKHVLWGVLQEANIFSNITNEHFPIIQNIFEKTINTIHNQYNDKPLIEKNKHAIESLIKNITIEKNKFTDKPNNNITNNIQMVYNSEAIKEERVNKINTDFNKHKLNMDNQLNPNKPKEIDFSMNNTFEDKPIGDDMDRLISERLASREKELIIPQNNDAENWIYNNNKPDTLSTNDLSTNNLSTNDLNTLSTVVSKEKEKEKVVTFNNNIQVTEYDNNITLQNTNTTNILNKLKKKDTKDSINSHIDKSELEQIHKKIDNIVFVLNELKINSDKIDKILEKVNINKYT